MSARYDCVVIGAGPGGSTAARELASRGLRVLLLERAVFPRDKPCGGGVISSAARRLPFSLEPVSERVVTAFRVTYRRGRSFEHAYKEPLAVMTQRRNLDALLVEHAVAAGVLFQDDRRVATLEIDHGGATIRLRNDDSVTARAVVAADGANGVVRRALGLAPLRSMVALEADASGVPERWRTSVGLELGTIGGGYGWIFPKDDHCNLGVGGWPATGPTLRRELDAYADSEGFPPDRLRGHRGHALPVWHGRTHAWHGPVAFVGDAAGLIDPLSGEGIGNAIYSGQLAAEEIVRFLAGEVPDLAGYQRALARELEPDLAVSYQLQALFHQAPWPYVQLLRRSSRFWRTFGRVVRGDVSYAGLKRRLGPAAHLLDLAAWQAGRATAGRSGWA